MITFERMLILVFVSFSLFVFVRGGTIIYNRQADTVEISTAVKYIEPPPPEEMIREVFGKAADTAIAIAKAESAMRPNAIGDKHLSYVYNGMTYGYSVGLFQIRLFPDRPHRDILIDPYSNVRYAYLIYKKHGFEAWGAYTNGTYKRFLPIPILEAGKTKVKPNKRQSI